MQLVAVVAICARRAYRVVAVVQPIEAECPIFHALVLMVSRTDQIDRTLQDTLAVHVHELPFDSPGVESHLDVEQRSPVAVDHLDVDLAMELRRLRGRRNMPPAESGQGA